MSDIHEPYQETLPFQLFDRGDFNTFVVGSNEAAVRVLKQALEQDAHEFYYVFGPHGCGKTHLLNALYRSLRNPALQCFYLDLHLGMMLSPQLLDIKLPQFIIIDNADAAAGDSDWELALFDLFNRWYDKRSGTLIMSASSSYDKISYERADLNTRLGSGVSLPLNYLDENQCVEALKKRANGRAFSMPDATAAFLVRHFNRDMNNLVKLLDILDRAQFSQRHQLTIPFVKKVLKM